MKINLLSYEPAGGWILFDYAQKLKEALTPYVHEVIISNDQRPNFDVTHHINYAGLYEKKVSGLHSTMVTHIDHPSKLALVNAQASAGVIGFCMSEDSARRLNSLTGNHLFFALSPPSMLARTDKRRYSILIAGRIYEDGRKNESWSIDFIKQFENDELIIRIIGSGWEQYVQNLIDNKYHVEYQQKFSREVYISYLEKTNYLLVTGFDEGALSTLDALLYGVIPICTSQGYHLEQDSELLLFQSYDQLMNIGKSLREKLIIKRLNLNKLTDWDSFAKAHISIWHRYLGYKS